LGTEFLAVRKKGGANYVLGWPRGGEGSVRNLKTKQGVTYATDSGTHGQRMPIEQQKNQSNSNQNKTSNGEGLRKDIPVAVGGSKGAGFSWKPRLCKGKGQKR